MDGGTLAGWAMLILASCVAALVGLWVLWCVVIWIDATWKYLRFRFSKREFLRLHGKEQLDVFETALAGKSLECFGGALRATNPVVVLSLVVDAARGIRGGGDGE